MNNISLSNFKSSGFNETYTGKEILGQPKLWKKTYEKLLSEQQSIQDFFVKEDIHSKNVNVILTGAGSSAFIGEIAKFAFKNVGFKHTQAIPTTNLVSYFTEMIDITTPLLLISFGRSGNSPESEAVFDLANKYCSKCSHLIISCNKNGSLAKKATSLNSYSFILPKPAEDKGLAMTGSFSSMLLAASIIADLSEITKYKSSVIKINRIAKIIFSKYLEALREIAGKEFKRIIFLGDGPNLGCAQEAHLKVQELSDGICIGKFDSFLGFRHGPKAVVDKDSLLVYLLSNKDSAIRYQLDLIEQISKQGLGLYSIAIGNTEKIYQYVNTNICLTEFSNLPEHLLPIVYVLVAQIIGFFKSKALSLDPDNPSQNGSISRVVKGVTIYDYNPKNDNL